MNIIHGAHGRRVEEGEVYTDTETGELSTVLCELVLKFGLLIPL